MSKTTMLGLDLGTDSMKWARMERGKVVQSDTVQLPENLAKTAPNSAANARQ